MKNLHYAVIMAVCFGLASTLDYQEHEVREALAAEYAAMLAAEQRCMDWDCMGELD